MGGGKGRQPPPPDYSQIAASNAEAARIGQETAREQLAWAQTQYAQDRADNKEITDAFLPLVRQQADAATKDRARYESIYQPLEDQLASEAKSYATEERKSQEQAKAVAAVDQQFEGARTAAEAQLTSYGLDPGQVRAGALDLGSRIAEAATKAGAANQSRTNTENVGRALRSEAINIGRGYPGQVAQSVATATGTGTAGVQSNLATTAGQAAAQGNPVAWQGTANQALGNWGNYSANVYQAQQAAQAAQPNIFGAIGGLAGRVLGGWASSGFAKEGGVIPAHMSPSGGTATDDVKMNLTAGEYVIPPDVVRRMGTDHLDKLVEKTRNPGAKGKPQKRQVQEAPAVDPDSMEALMAQIMARGGGGGVIPMQAGA